MTSFIQLITGIVGITLFSLNTIFWIIPILLLAVVKLILPIPAFTRLLNRLLNGCAANWISFNYFFANMVCKIEIEWPEGVELSTKNWYLVIANHQSWVDIYILQAIFNRKIPFLKFFLKKELIYVPLLGLGWWALDFPFMKRHSKAYLKKHPEKKGQDLATTKKACEKFKHIPISVMNFVEGTRFNPAKAQRQNSPYENLLKPKSGGVGTVLSILGEQMHTVLDVTIHYPEGAMNFWDFLCGKLRRVNVKVSAFSVDPKLIGDMNQNDTRIAIQGWVNDMWRQKDQYLQSVKAKS
ncbi:MAG: acyltransferase [Kangiellaceae bacterium]|jgi:1-acyl-sn-glycerol-3-phosphate acyltransferase|nr:acyltransferase [Kangiellaceae bacterium]